MKLYSALERAAVSAKQSLGVSMLGVSTLSSLRWLITVIWFRGEVESSIIMFSSIEYYARKLYRNMIVRVRHCQESPFSIGSGSS